MNGTPPGLSSWLAGQLRDPAPYLRFETTDVTEHEPCDDAIRSHLASLIAQSTIDFGLIEHLAELAGWNLAELTLEGRLPSDVRATRGRFGEVVSVGMLQEFDGYIVPVAKAHYAITSGQSQPSTDVLALRVGDQGDIAEICFVESKVRTTSDTAAPTQAARQLTDDYSKTIPDMITFTAARLRERGDDLYEPFMRYFASRSSDPRDTFRVAVFYDSGNWSETALQNLEDDESTIGPLAVVVTTIADLRDRIDEVFALAGIVAELDE